MKRTNATIKGTNASIYLHDTHKNYNYYAIYVEGHRIGHTNNGKLINYTTEQLKELAETFESEKRIRLDAWPRKNEFTKIIDQQFEVIFQLVWTNRFGETEYSTYKSKHCKLKYAKRKLNELYKNFADNYDIEQAYVYEGDRIVYSKMYEV